MTEGEAITVVTREIKALSDNFTAPDYADAVDSSERETGFSFPATDNFQIEWLIKRTKRALFFSLLSENTESFKFKQINLQDKFKNLKDIVTMMDNEFKEVLDNYSYLFPNATINYLGGISPSQLFGHKIDAGFAYDNSGRDITFDTDQFVEFTPKEGE